MRARDRTLCALLLLGLLAFPSAVLSAAPPAPAPEPRQEPAIVAARLGISAGDAIQRVERGTDRRALERIIPELFETASALGIRIDSVSVGRGFWSEDGEVESENDLDLVVAGRRENVYALGATLGQRWGQSSVLVWEPRPGGEMLTATLALPGGTAALDEAVFEALAKELTDGGHIRYAGPASLVFVAHTGDDPDEQFRARMARAKGVLEAAGARTGALAFGQAVMVELNRANYQQYVDGAVRGKAAEHRDRALTTALSQRERESGADR
jgi:hypothetical protein